MTFALLALALFAGPARVVASEAPVSCEHELAAPDLDVAEIHFTRAALECVHRRGFTRDWVVEKMRRSVRAPFEISSWSEPRFVVFLRIEGTARELVRADFFWNADLGRITVTSFSPFDQRRDYDLFGSVMSYAYLRHVENKFSTTDAMLDRIALDDISLAELDQAIAHPLAEVVEDLVYAGQFWFVGLTAENRALSIKYVELNGINYVKDVHPAHEDDRRAFVTASGFAHQSEADRVLTVTKGPLRFRKISFGVGLEVKIRNQHDLTRANVIEVLERSQGTIDEDITNVVRKKAKQPRKWIAGRLADGRYVKIVLAVERNGDLTVLTAHEIVARKYGVYKSLLKRFGR